MRADAIRNRQKLIEVSVDLVREVGGEPSRVASDERAGAGIGATGSREAVRPRGETALHE